MVKRTVTAFFEDRENANNAVLLLRRYAIPDEDVIVSPEAAATGYAEEMPAHARSFWASLAGLFGAADDRYAYAEGVRRGHVMVTAHVDEANVDAVAAMLERHGSIDLNERETAWRAEGWVDGSPPDEGGSSERSAEPPSTAEIAAAAASVLSAPSAVGAYRSVCTSPAKASIGVTAGPDDSRQAIGSRAVNRGKVRIHSHQVGRPPTQQGPATFTDARSAQRATGMEVVGLDGQHIGTIAYVEGTTIKLKRVDPASDGPLHHLIPTDWIRSIDDRLTLKFTAAEVRGRLIAM